MLSGFHDISDPIPERCANKMKITRSLMRYLETPPLHWSDKDRNCDNVQTDFKLL